MFGEVAGSLINMATGIVLVRLITPEQMGRWQVLMQLSPLFVTIFILGLSASVLYFVPRASAEERGKYIAQTIVGLFFMGVLAAVVLVVAAPAIAALYNQPDLTGYIRIFSLFVLFQICVHYTRRLFMLYDQTLLAAVMIMVDSLGMLLCFVVPYFLKFGQDDPIRTAVIFLAVFMACRVAFTTVLALRDVKPGDFRLSMKRIGRQLEYSAPLGLSTAVPAISNRADKVIMPAYLDAGAYGVYAIGAKEVPLAGPLAFTISSVIQPRLAVFHKEGNTDGLVQLWRDATVRSALMLLPLFAFLMAIADKAFVLLYTEKYAQGVWLFRIYLLMVPLYITMQRAVLAAFGRTKFVLLISILQTVGTIAAAIVMARVIHFYGPAIAVIGMAYLAMFVLGLRIQRELRVKWTRIWPVYKVLTILAVSLLAGVAAWAGARILESRILSCLIAAAIMCAVYVPLLFIFRLLDQKDRDLIRQNWQRLKRLLGIAS
jgi:O-antigen/teichoic acid export membrane protein